MTAMFVEPSNRYPERAINLCPAWRAVGVERKLGAAAVAAVAGQEHFLAPKQIDALWAAALGHLGHAVARSDKNVLSLAMLSMVEQMIVHGHIELVREFTHCAARYLQAISERK